MVDLLRGVLWICGIYLLLCASFISGQCPLAGPLTDCRCSASSVITCRRLDFRHLPTVPASMLWLDFKDSRVEHIQAFAFRNNSRLTRLHLQSSGIKTIHPNAFVGLTSVEQLFLQKNRIAYLAPGTFRNLPKLKRLYLHLNLLFTIQPQTFISLTSLRHVLLHKNALEAVHPGAFDQASLSQLHSLSLHDNNLHCNCSTRWLTSLIRQLHQHAFAEDSNDYYAHDKGLQDLIYGYSTHLQEPWLCSSPKRLKGSRIYDLTNDDIRCINPTVYIHPRHAETYLGGGARFNCAAYGYPRPTVQWLYQGRRLQPFSNSVRVIVLGGMLFIRGAQESDQGSYSCVASNVVGYDKITANLTFVPQQRPPQIMIDPQSKDVNVTDRVTFTCRTQKSSDSMSWLFHGKHISEVPRIAQRVHVDRGQLIIDNVQESDAGRVTCQARNQFGTTSSGAMLNVNVPPQLKQLSIAKTMELVQETLHKFEHYPHCNGGQYSLHRLVGMSRESFVQAISHIDEETKHHLDFVWKARRIIEAGHLQLETVSGQSRIASRAPGSLIDDNELQEVSRLSGCQRQRDQPSCHNMCFHRAFRSADGSCNNLDNPEWGASLQPLINALPPVYEDGFDMPKGYHVNVSAPPTKKVINCGSPVSLVRIPTPGELNSRRPLPSARLVSSRLLSQYNIAHDDNFNHFLMQFGQFLDHDITLSETDSAEDCRSLSCEEQHRRIHSCMSIRVPPDDERINTTRCMGMARSRATCGTGESSIFFEQMERRRQLNTVTSFIDGSQIYGSDQQTVRNLRQHTPFGFLRENQIRLGGKGIPPIARRGEADCMRPFALSPNRDFECLVAGDRRINEQLDLTALHLLWFRQHKHVVKGLVRLNPHWSDDRLYHEGRKIVGAQLQHITYTHWLPKVIGEASMKQLGSYTDYDSTINPGIFAAFSTAAFRFGHALINPEIKRLNASMKPIPEGNLRLRDAFFAVRKLMHEGGADPLVRGLLMTPSKRLTPQQVLSNEVTEHLFMQSLEIAEDLGALNIQRGRDHGLPGYNAYRRYCNLTTFETFEDMESVTDRAVISTLGSLYSSPDHVDVFVGGLLERPQASARIGPLFTCLIAKQMRVLRDGDRFWYENSRTFTAAQLAEIKKTSLSAIICDNSDNITRVPPDAFRLTPFPRGFVPCTTLPRTNLMPWKHCEDCDVFGCQSAGNRRRRDTVSPPHHDSADLLAFGQMSWEDIIKTMPSTRLAKSISLLANNAKEMPMHLKRPEEHE